MRPFSKGDVQLVVLSSANDLRTEWESWLLAGAFNQLAYEHHVRGAMSLEGPGSGARLGSWDHANKLPPHGPPASGGNAQTLADKVWRLGSAARAEVVDFQILAPYGLAPAITLRVRDPAAFLHYRLERFVNGLGDRWALYDGTFIKVVDANGRFVWATAGGSRMSIGSGGARPDLEGCVPYGGIAPPSWWNPPPCPA